MSTAINLHIERVIIDEAVHRAGPAAVRAALAAQLPALLAEHGTPNGLARPAAGTTAARLPSPSPAAQK